jgi:DNA repair protein RecO (recombination protein O)
MSGCSTPAILLRRIDFGDYDLILNLFTLASGKQSVMAKSAKKSVKRFSGVLELFSVLDIVYSSGRGKGLPVLQEAALKQPFTGIRASVTKMAYASYWAELVNEWLEEGHPQVQLFRLLGHVLGRLAVGQASEEALSTLFQMRFLSLAGYGPNLKACSVCRGEVAEQKKSQVVFDLVKGGLVCERCASGSPGGICLSKGTVKQLQWIENGNLGQAGRVRFTPQAQREGLALLEAFVPFHLGKEPRSLHFLRQIRGRPFR